MKTSDFYFELPPERIAQKPSGTRGESRLMTLDRATGKTGHHRVGELAALLESGALLVFNNSRVRKARLFGSDCVTGAKREFLLLNTITDSQGLEFGKSWQVLTKKLRKINSPREFVFAGGRTGRVSGAAGAYPVLVFDKAIDDAWLDLHGHIPLPPYIRREDEAADSERYQTVYARETGSAAAPTAGLHFTQALLDALAAKNIDSAFITLHVGLGTFLPVRTEQVEEHIMHTECYTIGDEAADKIERAKREGRPVVAVGTTTVRTLESAWQDGSLRRGGGSTAIFIYGDYQFRVPDALFTNFHTPESTLLMLVSSFCAQPSGSAERGREMLLAAYHEAIAAGYNFFSYGDAMLIR